MICIKCKQQIQDGSIFCQYCGKKQTTEDKKPLKRANGTGSVFKRSDRRRKAWVAKKGNTIIGYFERKTDALKMLESFSTRNITENFNLTFAEVFDLWSKEHFRSVGKKGIESYNTAFSNHAVDLHSRKMRELRTSDYQSVIDKLDKAGKSKSSLEKIKQLFGQMSRWAVREEICSTDFAQFIKLPEREKTVKEVFTDEEIRILFENDTDSTARIILIMIYTGVRIGELFTVPKSDVNIQDGYMVGGEKTKAGRNRIIAFPDRIMKYVTNLYASAPDGGLLIDGYDGDKNLRNFRVRRYYPLLDRLGIRSLNPHCTRHTFITRAVKQGVDMDNLLRIVGHADKDTTQLYLHDSAGTIRDLVKDIK